MSCLALRCSQVWFMRTWRERCYRAAGCLEAKEKLPVEKERWKMLAGGGD